MIRGEIKDLQFSSFQNSRGNVLEILLLEMFSLVRLWHCPHFSESSPYNFLLLKSIYFSCGYNIPNIYDILKLNVSNCYFEFRTFIYTLNKKRVMEHLTILLLKILTFKKFKRKGNGKWNKCTITPLQSKIKYKHLHTTSWSHKEGIATNCVNRMPKLADQTAAVT